MPGPAAPQHPPLRGAAERGWRGDAASGSQGSPRGRASRHGPPASYTMGIGGRDMRGVSRDERGGERRST
ncbi:MAG: hypothetical protein K2W85_07290 [Phycisphaerales bacterium]|nr:hypothetical protein [Phycisphaerales bacterium]